MENLKPAIVIMTKVPQPGTVKTRLRPILSDDQCAELSKCFLADTVTKALNVTTKVIVAYSAIGDERSIVDLLPAPTISVKQNGNDLGERMASAINFARSNGCSPIIVIGTDSPTLPSKILETALQRLAEPATELALGGTEDGGYYLIGMKHVIPSIFQGIPWSSDKVYSTTLERAAETGLSRIVELPKWYDVDTPEDLRRLFVVVDQDLDASFTAPETCRWIAANRNLFDQFSESVCRLIG
ncbi:MAG: TIGR04282 family arsenosugar biosynthesis glycosyltransferase [Acidobacteriota bacterium]